MKVKKVICTVIASLMIVTVCGATAIAGSASGHVSRILVHAPGVVMFDAGNHSGRPACSKVGNEWAFSLTTQQGKSMYALLLSAANLDIPVYVQGTGKCSAWGDREDVYFMLMDP